MNSIRSLFFICLALAGQASFAQEAPVIEDGSTVELEFTLKLEDGSLVQSNAGQEPLRYVQGQGTLLKALEEAVAGKAAEDELSITLSPEQGYGVVSQDLFREVPIEQIPEEARQVGAMLRAAEFNGEIRVHEVRDDVVVLDFNHPLAGQTLLFDLRIVSVSADSE